MIKNTSIIVLALLAGQGVRAIYTVQSMVSDCKQKHNVYKCELVAQPKGKERL